MYQDSERRDYINALCGVWHDTVPEKTKIRQLVFQRKEASLFGPYELEIHMQCTRCHEERENRSRQSTLVVLRKDACKVSKQINVNTFPDRFYDNWIFSKNFGFLGQNCDFQRRMGTVRMVLFLHAGKTFGCLWLHSLVTTHLMRWFLDRRPPLSAVSSLLYCLLSSWRIFLDLMLLWRTFVRAIHGSRFSSLELLLSPFSSVLTWWSLFCILFWSGDGREVS